MICLFILVKKLGYSFFIVVKMFCIPCIYIESIENVLLYLQGMNLCIKVCIFFDGKFEIECDMIYVILFHVLFLYLDKNISYTIVNVENIVTMFTRRRKKSHSVRARIQNWKEIWLFRG